MFLSGPMGNVALLNRAGRPWVSTPPSPGVAERNGACEAPVSSIGQRLSEGALAGQAA